MANGPRANHSQQPRPSAHFQFPVPSSWSTSTHVMTCENIHLARVLCFSFFGLCDWFSHRVSIGQLATTTAIKSRDRCCLFLIRGVSTALFLTVSRRQLNGLFYLDTNRLSNMQTKTKWNWRNSHYLNCLRVWDMADRRRWNWRQFKELG